jgi:hypothetical protein
MVKWKGFWRRRSWLTRSNIPAFAYRDWGKSRKTVGIEAEVRTEHECTALPLNQPACSYNNLRNCWMNRGSDIAQASHRGGSGSISGHVGCVVDKVTLGQVFFRYFGFSCQFSFRRMLHTHHLSSAAGTKGQTVAAVPSGLSLTPPQETELTVEWRHLWGYSRVFTCIIGSKAVYIIVMKSLHKSVNQCNGYVRGKRLLGRIRKSCLSLAP